MISFEPTEDQQLIVGTVAEFAKTTLAPRSREFEKARRIPEDVRKAAHELGLAMAAVPEAVGGQGLGLLTASMINEELAYGDSAAPYGLPGFGAFTSAALELGTEEQASALLSPLQAPEAHSIFGAVAWSERAPNRDYPGFATVAKKVAGGYELSGAKSFVGNAELADTFIVFAQVDAKQGWGGFGAFVVRKDNPGLKIGQRHETLGLDCANFGEIQLEGAKVSEADRLQGGGDIVKAVTRFFAKYSLLCAARQVGLARSSFDLTREYCDIRKAFGKPIGHFQAVAFNLADRHIDAESARELVRRAAWAWDTNQAENTALLWTAQAVAHAHEVAMRCGDDAVQLHGGAGFMRDVIVEKMMRDAKQIALTGATAEHMDQLAAALELGGALDPALVLPTPETQAVFT
ncbi:MAG TPA: acyl-CoA dehydrogenase family protein [Polyangiaceae bacterium]